MAPGNPSKLIATLRCHDVPFVVIGGHAVAFHGYARATEDVDVVFLRSEHGEATLLKALMEMNSGWISNEIDPATGIERLHPITASHVRASRLMMLVTDFGFLDVFDYVPGHPLAPVATLFESAVERDGIRFTSLGWLRKMKQAAARPQDEIDLRNLPGD